MKAFLLRIGRVALVWLPAAMLVFAVLVITGVARWPEPGYTERNAIGERWRDTGFTVAVVWPTHEVPDFLEGVKLAWEETDRGNTELAGKIHLRQITEAESRWEGGVASTVAADGDVMAVLGHAYPEHVVPASLVYESHGIVFITPQATDPRSTSHEFQYVFRLTPDDVQIAEALARYAVSAGYKRVGVIYSQSEHGESASRQFTSKAEAQGIDVPFYHSYHPTRGDWEHQDFRPLAAEIRKQEFDALMIADELPIGGKLVHDLVQMGVTQPILATDKFDSTRLWDIAGSAASNVFVASTHDPASRAPEYSGFRERFEKRFGVEPDYAAAQGYEAFMLVVRACLKSRDASPLVLATTIRLAPSWHGLFGDYSFHREGGLVGRHIAIKHVQDGRFAAVYSWKGSYE